jgi:hypothetical protein
MRGRRVGKGIMPNRTLMALGLAILVANCSTPLTIREKGVLAGGAIGAGAGAAIGSTTDQTDTGAPIGTGVGAVSAALIGDAMPANEQSQVVPTQAPATAPLAVSAPQPQTLHAREIKAGQVRADTIYANEIKAKDVLGQIYQTDTVETQGWYGKIEASVISASIIYAKQIKANSVTAQTIYVHKLEIK